MIFRFCHFGLADQDERRKDQDCKKLARASINQRHSGIFRLCKLLQKIYLKLLLDSSITYLDTLNN